MSPANRCFLVVITIAWLSMIVAPVRAEFSLCVPAQPITHRIEINTVQTFRDDGTDPSSTGTPRVYELVKQIYSQLGIDVAFHVGPTWNSTFAHEGTSGFGTRPGGDLFTILTNASAAGKIAASASTLNMFFVDIVPSFPPFGNSAAAGVALVNSNGMAVYVGPNVGAFASSEESAATIVAHEIGHNLGLDHSTEANNLMTAVVSGQCINAAQTQEIFANRRGFLKPVLACDLNGDGTADAADAGIMFGNWGHSGLGDCNHDGIVDAADAGLLFAEWTGDADPLSVPEPSGGALAALILAVRAARRPQRHR